ncbi:putative membrane protein YukC [Staphylococcus hominis]
MMARKHNLDKVSNHIMLETNLSEKDRDKLLDVVEAQINQNNDEQRRKEAKQQSKSSKSLIQMARENRIIKG